MNIQSIRDRLAEVNSQVQDIIIDRYNGYHIILDNGNKRYLRLGKNEEETFLNGLCALSKSFQYAHYPAVNKKSSIQFMCDFLTYRKFNYCEVGYVNDDRNNNLVMGVGLCPYSCLVITHEFKHTMSRKERCKILIEFMMKVLEWDKHNSFECEHCKNKTVHVSRETKVPWQELIVYGADGELYNSLEYYINESKENNLPITGLFLKEDGSLDYWDGYYLAVNRQGEMFDGEEPLYLVDWSGLREALLL